MAARQDGRIRPRGGGTRIGFALHIRALRSELPEPSDARDGAKGREGEPLLPLFPHVCGARAARGLAL